MDILDGRLADELIMEMESDEIIYAPIPMTRNANIMRMVCFDRDAYKEAMDYINTPIYATVEEALVAFRKKYKDAYDRKMKEDEICKKIFLEGTSCKYWCCCIQAADDLLDVLRASK